jgi:hypothetical protein
MTLATRTDALDGLTFALTPHGAGATLSLSWDTRDYTVAITAR